MNHIFNFEKPKAEAYAFKIMLKLSP